MSLFRLQRKDVDLAPLTDNVRDFSADEAERQAMHLADGTLVTGPPESDAEGRVVSLPSSLIAELDRHLAGYAGPEPEAWVLRSPTGVVPRKSNWSVYWCRVTASVGVEGLHFHDLRHTGNTLAASTGASTKELMSRMGHTSTRVAILYEHATRERDDAIAAGLDRLIAGVER